VLPDIEDQQALDTASNLLVWRKVFPARKYSKDKLVGPLLQTEYVDR